MKNRTKNLLFFTIEISIYSILLITFIILNFYNIELKIANIIYINFISLSFCYLFSYFFIFKKHDDVAHFKMFEKYYIEMPKVNKKEKYKRNITGVIIAWICYLLMIMSIKYLGYLTWQLFLVLISILFILNTYFSRKTCLLSILFMHNKNNCCKNCTINCWDYPIIASALIFAPHLSTAATILNIIIIIISFSILFVWEYNYHKYPYRFYQKTNKALNCKNCLKQCTYKK